MKLNSLKTYFLFILLIPLFISCDANEGNQESTDRQEIQSEDTVKIVEENYTTGTRNLMAVLEDTDQLSTMATVIQEAGYADTLKSVECTILAPTNDAFARLPEGTLDFLLRPTSDDQLDRVTCLHLIPGIHMSSDLKNNMRLTTISDAELSVSISDTIMINQAKLITSDLMASNGVIHVINDVIVPNQ
jgi:uncharacterized surface protein with fasciclin (FAS1) repeats